MNEIERKRVYYSLSPEEMAPLVAERLDSIFLLDYFDEMHSYYAAKVLESMHIDDAVSILSRIKKKNRLASYLSQMDEEHSQQLQDLLAYDEKTAGSLMTTKFIEFPIHFEIRQAMKKLIQEANEAETINTRYIVDERRRLKGTMSLRELILARAGEKMSDLMTTNVIKVEPDGQQEVAHVMRNYDLTALPVVDYHGVLIGIITIDDIVDVIDEEASEDYEQLAAVTDIDEHIEQNALHNALSRLPWLILLLLLGLINSQFLNLFENTLEKMVVLSFYLPLIAGMAGNTGTQTLAVTIRKITIEPMTQSEKVFHIIKEGMTGFVVGLITAVIAFILVYLIRHDWIVSGLVGISIFISLIVSSFLGSLIPLVMLRLKIDPAIASGPFITTLNDLISNLIYLGLATLILQHVL